MQTKRNIKQQDEAINQVQCRKLSSESNVSANLSAQRMNFHKLVTTALDENITSCPNLTTH